jgi:hypothetical protein
MPSEVAETFIRNPLLEIHKSLSKLLKDSKMIEEKDQNIINPQD